MQGRARARPRIKPVDPERAQFRRPGADLPDAAPTTIWRSWRRWCWREPGDVIVAAADGFSATAVVGDNVTMMAKNKGVAAIVIDGMARDSYGIVPVGLPVFARGITPNSCVAADPAGSGCRSYAAGWRSRPAMSCWATATAWS